MWWMCRSTHHKRIMHTICPHKYLSLIVILFLWQVVCVVNFFKFWILLLPSLLVRTSLPRERKSRCSGPMPCQYQAVTLLRHLYIFSQQVGKKLFWAENKNATTHVPGFYLKSCDEATARVMVTFEGDGCRYFGANTPLPYSDNSTDLSEQSQYQDSPISARSSQSADHHIGNILQRTKFDHIVASLSPEFATEIWDIIFRPQADTPYDTLKEQLVKRTATSKQIKLQQLFSSEEMGGQEAFPTSA